MKSKNVILVLLCLILALPARVMGAEYTPRTGSGRVGVQDPAGQESYGNPAGLGLAFVTHVSGEWLFKSTDTEEWAALSPNMSLRIGDRIWAQDNSKIEIHVWLPYDPWYAPFHFGRWGWRDSIGWFWIVPRARAYWSPGYVGWVVFGAEVSWVPLGYSEVYYGYGNYGPNSVNVHKTKIVNVTNVCINSKEKGEYHENPISHHIRGGCCRRFGPTVTGHGRSASDMESGFRQTGHNG